jgi:hypothetical protein
VNGNLRTWTLTDDVPSSGTSSNLIPSSTSATFCYFFVAILVAFLVAFLAVFFAGFLAVFLAGFLGAFLVDLVANSPSFPLGRTVVLSNEPKKETP